MRQVKADLAIFGSAARIERAVGQVTVTMTYNDAYTAMEVYDAIVRGLNDAKRGHFVVDFNPCTFTIKPDDE